MIKFRNLEFALLPEGNISYSVEGGTKIYQENDYDFTNVALDHFTSLHPDQIEVLKDEFSASRCNIKYHEYQVVTQFIACAFGRNNKVLDIDENGHINIDPCDCPKFKSCKWGICKLQTSKGLTPLETEVVDLLALGKSTADAAKALGIKYYTVRERIGNACKRFGLTKNASLLVAYCHKHKLI